MTGKFPACHGIGVAPPAIGLELGWLEHVPPRSVTVEVVDQLTRSPDAELVWELVEPPGFGLPAITGQVWEEADGCTWVANTLNMALRIDHDRGVVSVAAKDRNEQVVLEALASLALPLVAQRSGALVLHGSAACLDGSAVLLCAQGGSGKSSLLMGLVTAGWQALSEDQCAVDLDEDGQHRIWPGPNWVRLKHGATRTPLVADVAPRFEALDKIAWDLGASIAHAPARLERVVLLEEPGGEEVVWEPIRPDAVVAGLTAHATWIQRPDRFAAAVLPHIVKLAISVPGFRMRIPRQSDWLEHGVSVLTGP